MTFPTSTARRALALLTVVAVLTAACGGSDTDAATAPSASTELSSDETTTTAAADTASPASTTTAAPTTTVPEPVTWVDWVPVELPEEISIFDVAVGNRFWIAGYLDDAPILLASDDGVEFEPIDLAGLGITAETIYPGGRTIELAVVDGELLMTVAMRRPDHDAIGGTEHLLWLVRGDGPFEVVEPETSGLDQNPPGTENFRFRTNPRIAVTDDQVHYIVDGQWWLPFETNDRDHYNAVSNDGGRTWDEYSEDRDDRTRRLEAIDVVAAEGALVAVGARIGWEEDFAEISVTEDGIEWTRVPLPLPVEAPQPFVDRFALSPGCLLALGGSGAGDVTRHLWSSDDRGRSWQLLAPVGIDDGIDPRHIAWDGARFVLFGFDPDTFAESVWTSVDGDTWDPLESPLGRTQLPSYGPTIVVDDRVLAHTRRGLWWSPAPPPSD